MGDSGTPGPDGARVDAAARDRHTNQCLRTAPMPAEGSFDADDRPPQGPSPTRRKPAPATPLEPAGDLVGFARLLGLASQR